MFYGSLIYIVCSATRAMTASNEIEEGGHIRLGFFATVFKNTLIENTTEINFPFRTYR